MTRIWQVLVATALLAASVVSSTPTFAQEAQTSTRGARAANTNLPAGTGLAATENSPVHADSVVSQQAAAAAYQKALSSYSNGDVTGAFESMQQSYALSGRAELLFNLARLERELQRCEAALRDYNGYLLKVPAGKFRSDAEHAIVELQRECPAAPAPTAERASEAAPPSVAPEPPVRAPPLPAAATNPGRIDESYWTPSRIIGWSAIASGVISGGVALGFLDAAIAKHEQAARIAADYDYTPKDPPWQAEQDAQHRDLRAARVLGVAAGALVTGGVVFLLLSPKPGHDASAKANLAVNSSYLGVVCSGRF